MNAFILILLLTNSHGSVATVQPIPGFADRRACMDAGSEIIKQYMYASSFRCMPTASDSK